MPRVRFSETLRDEQGRPIGIACGHREVKACKSCGRPSLKLCDYPLGGTQAGKTCDAPLCQSCAQRISPEAIRASGLKITSPDTIDFCPAHSLLLKERVGP